MSDERTADRAAGYAAAVDDVLEAIRQVYERAGDPSPLHKGIRMACSSIVDRISLLRTHERHTRRDYLG